MKHQETLCVDGVIDRLIRQHGLLEKYDKRKGTSIASTVNGVFNMPTPLCSEEYVKERIKKIKAYMDQLEELKRIPIVEQRSPEWYKMRGEIITASDFAQALGDGKFGTQKQIFQKKCGYEEQKFNPSLPPLKWGTMFEPVANMLYERRLCCKIHEFGLLRHPTVDFFGASPDGITDYGIMVEIKCPFKRKITGEVPLQYYYQIQGQLDVCRLEECDYLECEFVDYNDIDELKAAHNEMEVGAILEYTDTESQTGCKYFYSPAYVNDYTSIEQWCQQEKAAQGDTGFVRVHYWALATLNIVRIYKNEKFVSEKLESLGEVWKKVKEYQCNKGLYDAEVQSGPTATKNKNGSITLTGYAFKDTS